MLLFYERSKYSWQQLFQSFSFIYARANENVPKFEMWYCSSWLSFFLVSVVVPLSIAAWSIWVLLYVLGLRSFHSIHLNAPNLFLKEPAYGRRKNTYLFNPDFLVRWLVFVNRKFSVLQLEVSFSKGLFRAVYAQTNMSSLLFCQTRSSGYVVRMAVFNCYYGILYNIRLCCSTYSIP